MSCRSKPHPTATPDFGKIVIAASHTVFRVCLEAVHWRSCAQSQLRRWSCDAASHARQANAATAYKYTFRSASCSRHFFPSSHSSTTSSSLLLCPAPPGFLPSPWPSTIAMSIQVAPQSPLALRSTTTRRSSSISMYRSLVSSSFL